MKITGLHPYKLAARAMYQWPELTFDQAFLGFWYQYRDKDPQSFYWCLSRVRRYNPLEVDPITEEQMLHALSIVIQHPMMWPIMRNDLRYCRVCYREKIYQRLRCRHCYRYLRLQPEPKQARLCGVPGCDQPHVASGRCRKHYQQAYRSGTLWQPVGEHGTPFDHSQLYFPSSTDDILR